MKKMICFLVLLFIMGCEKQIIEPVIEDLLLPKQPVYVSPINNEETDSLVVFRWNVSERATAYKIQISKDSLFTPTELAVDKIVGDSSVFVFFNSLPNQIYFWRIFGINSNGVSDPIDVVWKFKRKKTFPVSSMPPEAPVLLAPANYTLDIEIPILFTWNKSDGVNYYQVEIAEDSTFSEIRYRSEHLFSENYSISNLHEKTKFFWRVLAYNSYGYTPSSSVFTFSTQNLLTIPSTVVLWAPENGSVQNPVPITLSWAKSARAQSYSLHLASDKNYTNILRKYTNIPDTFKIVDSLDGLINYYWRVSAENSAGSSGFLMRRGFKTKFNFVPTGSCPGVPDVVYAGKTYHTVQIADQCWLKENLNVGVIIADSTSKAKNNGIIEKRCYNNDSLNCEKYGGLYEWREVINYASYTTGGVRGICPEGWHVPTLTEITSLADKVGNSNYLKAVGEGAGMGAGTDYSGFSLLLGGYLLNLPSRYGGMGITTLVMSGDLKFNTSGPYSDYYRIQVYGSDQSIRIGLEVELRQGSVRCIKDN